MNTAFRKLALVPVLALITSAIAPARADEVTHWNRLATDAAAAAKTDPVTESRLFAMLHVAVHDAVNAVEPRYETYSARLPALNGSWRKRAPGFRGPSGS